MKIEFDGDYLLSATIKPMRGWRPEAWWLEFDSDDSRGEDGSDRWASTSETIILDKLAATLRRVEKLEAKPSEGPEDVARRKAEVLWFNNMEALLRKRARTDPEIEAFIKRCRPKHLFMRDVLR